ncbi:MAG: hypothetical protein IKV16_00765 [Clostridia bacterium]|nr:hypothetical protein [Clostridia bacterium]
MKKVISAALAVILLVGSIFTLVSCNISESYAEKINKAADAGEHYTYEEVLEDLGEDAVDITVVKTGVIVAVKGCSSLEDIKAKLDAGDEVKGIVVTVALGKATGAKYKSITADDLKI